MLLVDQDLGPEFTAPQGTVSYHSREEGTLLQCLISHPPSALCQAMVYQRSWKSLTGDLVPSPPSAGDPGQVSAELLTHGDEETG